MTFETIENSMQQYFQDFESKNKSFYAYDNGDENYNLVSEIENFDKTDPSSVLLLNFSGLKLDKLNDLLNHKILHLYEHDGPDEISTSYFIDFLENNQRFSCFGFIEFSYYENKATFFISGLECIEPDYNGIKQVFEYFNLDLSIEEYTEKAKKGIEYREDGLLISSKYLYINAQQVCFG